MYERGRHAAEGIPRMFILMTRLLWGLAIPLLSVAPVIAEDLSRVDEFRVAEALRLIDVRGSQIWPGWESRTAAICLETQTLEYLLYRYCSRLPQRSH